MDPNKDRAVIEYAEKHGCTIAAARLRMAAEALKEKQLEIQRPDQPTDEEISR